MELIYGESGETMTNQAKHIFQSGEPECVICNQYRYATVHQQAEQRATLTYEKVKQIAEGSYVSSYDRLGLARALISSQDALQRILDEASRPDIEEIAAAVLLPRKAGGE